MLNAHRYGECGTNCTVLTAGPVGTALPGTRLSAPELALILYAVNEPGTDGTPDVVVIEPVVAT
jgi:hypothetical protein